MFIELTDHLRCPVEHEESFLVLLPDRIDDRSVRTGQLGCPVCGRTYRIVDGVWDAGGVAPADARSGALNPAAITALAGLSGPGGYLVVVGGPGGHSQELAELNSGVGLVLVNPPPGVSDRGGISVIRGSRLPLRSRSMRGVVLGAPYGSDPVWVAEAARVVLPGLRVVGEGPAPEPQVIDLMAEAGGVWVGSPHR
jgi:uncharacterized protein YbaR (Trm112 family)